MKFVFCKSFEKSLKKLNQNEKDRVLDSCQSLIDIFEGDQSSQKGIGLKKLKSPYWEVRVNIKIRIIFSWNQDVAQFILVGSHDDIKDYLKENV